MDDDWSLLGGPQTGLGDFEPLKERSLEELSESMHRPREDPHMDLRRALPLPARERTTSRRREREVFPKREGTVRGRGATTSRGRRRDVFPKREGTVREDAM